MAFLYSPANPAVTEALLEEQVDAASSLGVRLLILKAANPSESSLPSRPSPSNALARFS
jgi:hypothetical protein